MSRFHPNSEFSQSLKDKVLVLTGGATGIGAACLEVFLNVGAKVVFGDVNVEESEKQLGLFSSERIKLIETDVTKYGEVVSLFDLALKTWGRIDVAVSNAGLTERGNWVDPDLSLEEIKGVPDQNVLDVNLLGSLYFARVAAVYLRQGQTEDDDKSIIFLSSIVGFKETSGMPVYQTNKHGIHGLMRCLCTSLPQTAGICVNAVYPWFVDTVMVAGIATQWRKARLPLNLPVDVANVIVDVAAERNFTGNSLLVEGGRAWEIEKNIDRLEPEWLGVENAKEIKRGNYLMGSGEFWQT